MADSTTAALTGTLILGALTFKGIDLVKYVVVMFEPHDSGAAQKAWQEARNGLVTLGIGCLVGVGIVWLFALTSLADQVSIGDLSLGSLGWASKIALGLAMTSVAGVIFDGKKAIDNTDSASKVKLFPEPEEARQDFRNHALRHVA